MLLNKYLGTNTSLIRVDDAFDLAYTPIIPANWAPLPPTTVQEALDRIAALLAGTIGTP